MKHLPTILTTAAILASAATARLKADLVVDSWSFLTLVRDFTPPASESDASYFEDVQTPFSASHSAAIPAGSYSTATYDIGWLLDEAHFDITTAHHLEQLDGETITSGRMYFTPSVDSIVTFTGSWQYAWPSTVLGNTHFFWGISDLDHDIGIIGDSRTGGNVGVGSPFGSWTSNGSGLLMANQQYFLFYSATTRNFDPKPLGTFGEASGEFHFTIAPIPEPAAAFLLALPFLAKRPRRLP
ncbi:hypothetical protein B7486_12880 [cyanobacterium TDX16]|nr:hypothetical protein B7486_12880 [cyanobacterium TDX16]